MNERDKGYLLLGVVAIFFIIVIAYAFVFKGSAVIGEFAGLGKSAEGPFLAFANGMASLVVAFFTNLWNHITGAFGSLAKDLHL